MGRLFSLALGRHYPRHPDRQSNHPQDQENASTGPRQDKLAPASVSLRRTETERISTLLRRPDERSLGESLVA